MRSTPGQVYESLLKFRLKPGTSTNDDKKKFRYGSPERLTEVKERP